MDVNDLVKGKIEPKYMDDNVDKAEVKVRKNKMIFRKQVHKGVQESQVYH